MPFEFYLSLHETTARKIIKVNPNQHFSYILHIIHNRYDRVRIAIFL